MKYFIFSLLIGIIILQHIIMRPVKPDYSERDEMIAFLRAECNQLRHALMDCKITECERSHRRWHMYDNGTRWVCEEAIGK